MSARLTTSPARRARYSSSAYSLRGERHVLAPDADAAAACVERERPHHEPFRQKREAAASNESPEPREQLAEVERLHQVVVRAAIEALDPGVDGVTRRHHQDRHQRPGGADRAADGESVFDRQHHVEDDRIVIGRACPEEGRLAIGRHIDGVGLFA